MKPLNLRAKLGIVRTSSGELICKCSSTLPHKAEVTVEPEGAPPPTAEPAVGSFFATVVEGDSERGYKLIDAKGIDVPGRIARARLRHRVWQTTCAYL